MNKKNIVKILKNEYFFSLITKAIMVFLGLIESALLARYLGSELRGELSYIYSLASTGYLLITCGIYTAYPFKRKNECVSLEELLNEFMTVVSVLFVFYALIIIPTAVILCKVDSTVSFVLILLLAMAYDKITSFICMIEHPNRMNFVTASVSFIQCLYLILLFFFASSSIVSGVGYYLLGCIIKSIYFTKKLNFHFNIKLFSIKKLVEYAKFGFFPMIALLLTTLNYRLDVIMLEQYTFITMSQIGIYSIGTGLSEKALLIPDAIKEILLSKLAKGKGEDEVARVMRISFFASIFTAILITIFSGVVIRIFYGSEYVGAEQVTYISIWGTITMVFFKMVSQYNVIQHKQHLNVVFLSIAIAINVVLNMLLIPLLGLNGAAIATAIGYLISSLIFLTYFHKVTHIPYKKMIFLQQEDVEIVKSIFRK